MPASTILSDNGVSSGSAGLKPGGGNDGTLQLQTTTAGGTATTALTINTSQNVGIGTTSPSQKLTVAGVIESTTGGIKFPDATTQTTAATASTYVGMGGQVFTTVGASTFTIPSGVTAVKVTVVGGGGGGGGVPTSCGGLIGGAGGGAGAAIKYLTGLTAGATLSVTVGAGGTAGAATTAGAGGTGGTSSVASGTQTISTISATGGGAGPAYGGSPALAAGGSASGGDLNLPGSAGWSIPNSYTSKGGNNSIFAGSATRYGAQSAGVAGIVYGGGGAGAYSQGGAFVGGAGAQGVVIFEW